MTKIYYIISGAAEERFGMLERGAHYKDGRSWNPSAPPFDPNPPTDMLYAIKTSRRPIGDCMFMISCSELILSERALKVFRECNPCPSLLWIPLTVEDKKGIFVANYYVVDTPRATRYYVLDLVNSEVKYYPKTDVIWQVLKWALDPESLPPYNLFCTQHHKWLCTDSLKAAVEDAGLTNFRFEKIWEG